MKGGLPTVAVHDIVIHPRERDLVIGTHGRGIYIFDDISPLEQMTPEVTAKPAHLFPVRSAVALKVKESPKVKSNEFVGQNPPYGVIIQYYLKNPVGKKVNLTVRAGGYATAVLEGSGAAGLHQVVWNLRPNLQGGGEQAVIIPQECTVSLQAGGQVLSQEFQVHRE
jgi:hypothetical protein